MGLGGGEELDPFHGLAFHTGKIDEFPAQAFSYVEVEGDPSASSEGHPGLDR